MVLHDVGGLGRVNCEDWGEMGGAALTHPTLTTVIHLIPLKNYLGLTRRWL